MGYPPPRGTPLISTILAVVVGIAIFVGLLLVHVALLIPRPASPYSTPPPQSYQLTVMALGMTGMAIVDLAIGLAVAVALYQSVSRPEMSEAARRGTFLFATAFLVAWLVMGTFLAQALASLIRYGY